MTTQFSDFELTLFCETLSGIAFVDHFLLQIC